MEFRQDHKMKKLFFRQTKRLQVRPLSENDYSSWQRAYSNMRARKNEWDNATNRPATELTKAKYKSLLKDQTTKRKKEEFCDYGVFLNATGEYIGRVSLMNFVRSVTQSSFLGYALFNPYWGQGYAEEAVRDQI